MPSEHFITMGCFLHKKVILLMAFLNFNLNFFLFIPCKAKRGANAAYEQFFLNISVITLSDRSGFSVAVYLYLTMIIHI